MASGSGRAAVRQAVTAFFQNAGLPYVGTVYSGRTYVVDMTDYTQLTGSSPNGSDAILMVNMVSDRRVRVTMTGRGSPGYVYEPEIHPIALEIFFGNSSGDPIAAQNDYDTIIDQIIAQVRGNPTLGNNAVIFSAGEFSAGVKHVQSEIFVGEDGMTVLINGVVEFEAWEWIMGQGV